MKGVKDKILQWILAVDSCREYFSFSHDLTHAILNVGDET